MYTKANKLESVIHNSCKFEIVRYFSNKFVVKITPLNGVFENGDTEDFVQDFTENLTSLSEWVIDNY